MNFRVLLFLAAMTFAMTASAGDEGDDAKKIQGSWSIASAELGGSSLAPQVAKTITLKMGKGTYEVQAENVDKGTYTIDPSAKPKSLDIIGTDGPNTGKHLLCIYELHGDVLKICYELGDGPRPAEFKSPAGTQIFLVTYKRKTE